jgi:hypothetical protein
LHAQEFFERERTFVQIKNVSTWRRFRVVVGRPHSARIHPPPGEVSGFVAELVCGDSANAEKLPVSEGRLRSVFPAVEVPQHQQGDYGGTGLPHPIKRRRL